ncbi:acyl-CoA reductase-like NAD-dependent aldehyde dehydrogenase [Allocatelliglobosispora scoriae]|uniref:Acyl-CoA reductase-like NAD-dependent aldehyde dehydrogenase n=1 Tax=Allocatelliglobosispora scoriae TaxID=643052 RepID=A0A841BQU7_9ACTN|nr:aldehyde dehydrogenase family protein [Allocatelliglobosispora scoriae]MBB5870075.1 acyl-CoA reductase-like NAD-dependent aldehyde dehydrogenase [Allocatelliglobosispora scoriae]
MSTEEKPLPEQEREAEIRPLNPATLDPLGRISASSAAEIGDAAERAAAALPGWSADARRRHRVLAGWAEAIIAYADQLAAALVAETGKTITEAHREVRDSAAALTYAARIAHRLDRGGDPLVAHLIREPVGVTSLVVSWDWPLLLLLRDLAPALAAGATALIKPAPQTTNITHRVLALGRAAGLPEEAAQVLAGPASAGRAAIGHPAIRTVAFTGSARSGAQILRSAGQGVRRPVFELGSKGTIIVCADADLAGAARSAAAGATVTAGQMMMTCMRVLVDRRHHREMLDRLTEAFRALPVGDPADPRNRIGPIVTPGAGELLAAYLSSVAMSATLYSGGQRIHPDALPGYFLSPAVVTDLTLDSPLIQRGLFGPIIAVMPFDTEPDAVRLANATPFGLGLGVWTRDPARAWRLTRAVPAGTTRVNGYRTAYQWLPSSGFKASGIGDGARR